MRNIVTCLVRKEQKIIIADINLKKKTIKNINKDIIFLLV